MNNKLLTIIVPVYKAEKFLDKCIQSILAQDYQNLEIILIDDGSPDKSGEICDYYAGTDTRIKVIHQNNKGVAKSIKECFYTEGLINGEYVGFVDSDDWIAKNMYSTMIEKAIQHDCDMVCCGIEYVRKEENERVPLNIEEGFYNKDEIYQKIHLHIFDKVDNVKKSILRISRVTNIFKRDLINQNLKYYKENIIFAEDYAFFLSCILDATKLYILNLCPYYYFVNVNSTTAKKYDNFWEQAQLTFLNLINIVEDKNKKYMLPQIYNVALGFAVVACARVSLYHLKFSQKIKKLKDIIHNHYVQQGIQSNFHYNTLKFKILIFLMKYKQYLIIYLLSKLYFAK